MNSSPEPQIILITGAMAAGKSSVAQALAERLPSSVHVRGDLFRRMIVNGRAAMDVPLSAEAERQLQLRYDLAAETARRYAQSGWTVVYQDIILGPMLIEVVASLRPFKRAVVVLCPRADSLAARDLARHKQGYPDRATADALDQALRTATPRIGYWLDNSDQTLAETVDVIMQNLRVAIIDD